MKITIVQGPFLPIPPLLGGAIEKIWYALGKQFASKGHEVTHISRSYKGLADSESVNGVSYKRFGGFNSPQSIVFRLILDFIYAFRVYNKLPKADILVTNSFTLPLLIRTKKYGALYVHIARYPKGQFWLYRHADRLQTISNVIANAIISQEESVEKKVKIIPNPLPYDIEDLDIEECWSRKKNQVLYVGRIHPEKGINILIEAFIKFARSNSSDWTLKIIGPWQPESGGGGKSYYNFLKKLSNPLKDKINWVDPIYDQQVLNSHYKESKLFIYPTVAEKGEALPLAPVEAMSHGCVPLVSHLECFNDYIEEEKTGFYFNSLNGDPVNNLSIILKNLINFENKLKSVALNSYSISKKYSLNEIAEKYLKDFKLLTA